MIWCVEDDADIRDVELYALRAAGYEAEGYADGLVIWEALKKEKPELILLDVMLPGMDGFEILTKMKASAELNAIPVVLATAKGQEYDRIHGLDLGADDYIVKPFGMMEMVARVKAVLRRSRPRRESKLLQDGGLEVNPEERTVTVNGERVTLTFKEFELLCLFLSGTGRTYTREQLFSLVWRQDYTGESRTLDSHIRTLRQKLGEYGKRIRTMRGAGYRWEVGYDK